MKDSIKYFGKTFFVGDTVKNVGNNRIGFINKNDVEHLKFWASRFSNPSKRPELIRIRILLTERIIKT